MINTIKQLLPTSLKVWVKDLIGYRELSGREKLLKQLPQGSIGVEIGVHEGDFSAQILDIVQPTRLYLVDPWEFQTDDTYENALYGGHKGIDQSHMNVRLDQVKTRFADAITRQQVIIQRGYSNEVIDAFDDQSLDWVYIDGNHLYEYVKQDLELYYDKVTSGGYLTGDDYNNRGWWEDGVTRAVDEFVHERQLTLQTPGGGQFIIQKP